MTNLPIIQANRDCGNCHACCDWLPVVELQKPAYVRCGQLCAMGCRDYASRPAICRDYQCLWLRGLLPESERPDRVGCICSFEDTSIGRIVTIREKSPGATETRRCQRMIQRFRRSGYTVVIWNSRYVTQFTTDGRVKKALIADGGMGVSLARLETR